MLEVEIIHQPDRLASLADEWDALIAASDEDNVFRRHLWQSLWWNHFGERRTLLVLAAREEGRLIGLAPMFIDRSRGWLVGRSVQFLGTTDGVCSEYLGFIVERLREPEVVNAFLDKLFGELGGRWDVLRLSDIPDTSPQWPVIERFLAERGLKHSTSQTTNRVVELAENWPEFEKRFRTKQRKKVRRANEAFDDVPGVEYVYADSPESRERIWQELKRLHTEHWQAQGQPGCFADPRWDNFHTELMRTLYDRGQLMLASLRVHGEAIACSYGFHAGIDSWEYQRGHSSAWVQKFPGHTLQFHMFRSMMDLGVRRWDFLRGDYRHKRDWATAERTVRDYMIPAPRTLATARYCMLEQYRRQRRRLGQWRRQLKQMMDRKLAAAPAATVAAENVET